MKIRLFTFTFLFLTSLSAQDLALADGQPDRGGEARAGRCLIRPEEARLRAGYEALSSSEIESIKKDYLAMNENDEPPFPVDGLSKIDDELMRVVPKTVPEGDIDITIDITVDIDAKGDPVSVSYFERNAKQASKYMAIYLMQQKYKPALCNCIPCRQSFWYRRFIGLGRPN